MIKDPELEKAVLGFVETFAAIFDNDWEMTKGVIGDALYISPSGTFINPRCPTKVTIGAIAAHFSMPTES